MANGKKAEARAAHEATVANAVRRLRTVETYFEALSDSVRGTDGTLAERALRHIEGMDVEDLDMAMSNLHALRVAADRALAALQPLREARAPKARRVRAPLTSETSS